MITLKKILFPTDFSEYADNALPYALELARKFEARVTLVHVLSPPTYAVSPEFAVDLTAIQNNMQQTAEKKMGELAARFTEGGVQVESVIQIGSAFAEIIGTARAHDVDLIVMATHGYGAVRHLLLGSTAEKVVRKAPCPVLTVRHPEHEFVHPSARVDSESA